MNNLDWKTDEHGLMRAHELIKVFFSDTVVEYTVRYTVSRVHESDDTFYYCTISINCQVDGAFTSDRTDTIRYKDVSEFLLAVEAVREDIRNQVLSINISTYFK